MTSLTRRGVVGGLLAGAALPSFAEGLRPMPRPGGLGATAARTGDAAALVAAARLTGVTGFVVADAGTGRVLEQVNADVAVPPASVTKAVTSLFALEKLGSDHRFVTRVLAVGSLRGRRLDGDLVLAGGGDPTLDSDTLGDLAAALAKTGIREVTGRYLAYAGALPSFERITDEQPVQVGYDPGLSGLSLNFNRVNFEWAKGGATVQMNARGERFVPVVRMARMDVADRKAPLFAYEAQPGVELWSVARGGLGKAGSRWLPVRQVAPYVAEVFQTLCAAQGIALPKAQVVQVLPAGATLLVQRQSEPLTEILRDMLRFSTNITAETVGLAASGAAGLAGSAAAMQAWAAGRLRLDANFVDHSGLGSASRVTAGGMMRALLAGAASPGGTGLRAILRDIGMRGDDGKVVKGSPVKVRAKSGTLNFVSGLAGFISPPGGRDLCFAIFSADVARREAVPLAEREEAAGSREWVGRARLLQARLINRWAGMV